MSINRQNARNSGRLETVAASAASSTRPPLRLGRAQRAGAAGGELRTQGALPCDADIALNCVRAIPRLPARGLSRHVIRSNSFRCREHDRRGGRGRSLQGFRSRGAGDAPAAQAPAAPSPAPAANPAGTPPATNPPPAAPEAAKPAEAAPSGEGSTGETVDLPARPFAYVEGKADRDEIYSAILGSLGVVKREMDKAGLVSKGRRSPYLSSPTTPASNITRDIRWRRRRRENQACPTP